VGVAWGSGPDGSDFVFAASPLYNIEVRDTYGTLLSCYSGFNC